MLKALIVDDEKLGAQALHSLLKMYCPDVKVMGLAHSADEAEKKIVSLNPDLVFLDIEMPYADGFELLHRISQRDPFGKNFTFDVIFTTAYNEYAVKAIKHNALDYLLKPIDPEELVAAVKKCENKRNTNPEGELRTLQGYKNLEKIISNLSHSHKVHKLPVPCAEGIVYLNPENIVYLRGDQNYTHFHLVQGQKLTSSKNLKEFSPHLPEQQFFRIHKAYIINLAYVKKYIKGDGGEVEMTDGAVLDVSRQKKMELLAILSV